MAFYDEQITHFLFILNRAANAIRAAGGNQREWRSVRHKWRDLQGKAGKYQSRKRKTGKYYLQFLYSACFFLPQLGLIGLLVKSIQEALYYSPVDAWLGGAKLYSIVFLVGAFSKTHTSRNVLNGAGRTHRNRAIVYKQLSGFSDFNAGLIIIERIKMIL